MPLKRQFFKSARKYFREYCDLSTIHGMKYLAENRTNAERGWWLIVFLLSLTCCSYSIYLVSEKWKNTPIIISFANEEIPIYQIPFPAVTICPLGKSYTYGHTKIIHKLDNSEPISETEYKSFSYINLICDDSSIDLEFSSKPKNFSFDDNFFNQDEFYNFILNITDLYPIIFCRWRNQIFPCRDLFDMILTDDGICYSFNLLSPKRIYKDDVQNYLFDPINHETYDRSSNWSLDRGYSHDSGIDAYPRRALFAGATNGLDVYFYEKLNVKDPLCKWPLQGFKVILHTPSTVPRLSQEHLYLPLNKLLIGAIKPVVVNTSDQVKELKSLKRKCYFQNESSLRYFKEYTQNNCELDCLTRYTLYLCGCVAFYMPMDNVTTICSSRKKKCMKEAERRMLSKKLKWNSENADDDEKLPQCECLPLCSDLSYEVETSSMTWWSPVAQKQKPHTEVSRLVIYFKKNQFIPLKRQEFGDFIDILGIFGGLLGLFTGFSILSIIEIIYFLTVRLLYNIRLYGQWSGKKDEENNS
ncbi:hypothetical protein ABEB36_012522 [Hypothenemus hampei]|uniref:Uncharacterized protein n=1 Tax=Hypothenemus hampei TaxID=57062 RepID=A0ABD1EBK2_HYPHA